MKIFLSLILILSQLIFAQNADSLYSRLVREFHPDKVNSKISKCDFGLMATAVKNFSFFSENQKIVVKQILSRPATDTSLVSPNGKFRVHFNLDPNSSPKYDINKFLTSLDSVYDKEITEIGFPFPPPDNGAGGDDLYDFYIVDLGTCCYGYTTPETDLGGGKFTTFVTLDNDYGTGFYTHGIDAAKVTAAHEFNHGVQLGNYIYRADDLFYYELTSTSMEDFVFDYVDDYIAYMGSYFNHPDLPFTYNDGYNLAIWNIFVRDVFGYSAIVQTWREMPTHRAVEAIDFVLQLYSSDFKRGLNLFGEWVYFTSYRKMSTMFFKDADKYPLVKLEQWASDPLTSAQTLDLNPLSNIYKKEVITGDTLVTLITNGDVNGALASPNIIASADYRLYTSSGNGSEISPNLFYDLQSADLQNLQVTHFINNNLPGVSGTANEKAVVYPQPFKYYRDSYIYFPVPKNQSETVVLKIISLSGKILYRHESLSNSSMDRVGWDGLDLRGNKLGTGVYIFQVEKNGIINRGKFVIIN
jgi:hypothetical protein